MDRNKGAWNDHLARGWKAHPRPPAPLGHAASNYHAGRRDLDNLAPRPDVHAQPRIDWKAIVAATVHEFADRRQGLKVLCGRSDRAEHVTVAESADVTPHGVEDHTRSASSAIGRQYSDLERADGIQRATEDPIVVGPTNDAIPTRVGQFHPVRQFSEREGRSEGSSDGRCRISSVDYGE